MSPEAALRREVGQFRRGEHRRRFPVRLSLGELAGSRVDLEAPTEIDAQLGIDLALLLAEQIPDSTWGRQAWWITRPGVPDVHEMDNIWVASTSMAGGVLGRAPLPLYVITRAGWLDPMTGASRRWVRLRL